MIWIEVVEERTCHRVDTCYVWLVGLREEIPLFFFFLLFFRRVLKVFLRYKVLLSFFGVDISNLVTSMEILIISKVKQII